jgi:hypothetical protein
MATMKDENGKSLHNDRWSIFFNKILSININIIKYLRIQKSKNKSKSPRTKTKSLRYL